MQLDVRHWRQRQQGECLVACVAMVLTYIGQRARYDRLRAQLDTSTAGTFFFNLDRLRSFWFMVKRNQGNLTILREQLAQGHLLLFPLLQKYFPIGSRAATLRRKSALRNMPLWW